MSSSIKEILSRIIKVLMVVALLPLAMGLASGIYQQLEIVAWSGGTIREWITIGFVSYVTIHLLLLRPEGLFRAGHQIFATLAVWLFGGQVSAVDETNAKSGRKTKIKNETDVTEGSTLVAFSPYVVPLFMVITCVIGWLLRRWIDRSMIDGPISFLIGFTIAFHWLMTADDLQKQRDRWHIETYLLALGLVFVLTLVVSAACLPMALPEFSFLDALGSGFSSARTFYGDWIQNLVL